jgi:hypothetical protein
LYVLVGVAFTLLSLVVAIAAYHVGKGGKKDTPSSEPESTKQGAPGEGVTPGLADKLLTPLEAAERIGEVQTVEFKVASIGEDRYMALNSERDDKHSNNLAVRIAANYFQDALDRESSLRVRTRSLYEGKVIRARGTLQRDELTKSTYLEVHSPKNQIVVVREQ